ncbi:MAG: NTP transferase domain-containing protein [Thermoplasmata archaeon]|nr:NTP transferase domain-containing protein [Thermoplasmata archaeon]
MANDMPFIERGLITRLIDAAQSDPGACVVPVYRDEPEPLHAIYPRCAIPLIKSLIDEDKLALKAFLDRFPYTPLEIGAAESMTLTNINHPYEYQRVAGKKKRAERDTASD